MTQQPDPPVPLGTDMIGEVYYKDTPLGECAWCHKLAVAQFMKTIAGSLYCAVCLVQPAPLSYVQEQKMPLHIGLKITEYGADDALS